MTPTEKSSVLIEALPYLQRFSGSTFLIKMGGSCMEDPDLVRALMRDLVFLKVVGIAPVVVHGGGKRISAAMAEAQIEANFLEGLRVTSDQAIDIVEKTLSAVISPEIVSLINSHGGQATAIPGTDVFLTNRITSPSVGRVGRVTSCHVEDLLYATSSGIIPVISPLGRENDTGLALNINADLAAAALAKQLGVRKLVYISDVPGLLKDVSNPKSLIQSINRSEASGLIADGTISGGMLPKIQSALDALDHGVSKVHFVDGRLAHTLLLEIFTQEGIGTELVASR